MHQFFRPHGLDGRSLQLLNLVNQILVFRFQFQHLFCCDTVHGQFDEVMKASVVRLQLHGGQLC